MTTPWLRSSVDADRLEADLRARGWGVWWSRAGSLRLTSPDGTTLEFNESTSKKTMRRGYEAAQEHAARIAIDAALDAEEWAS